MVLDTGSYMPWVKVKGWCTTASCPGIEPTFNPALSSSFTALTNTPAPTSAYGTGHMGGLYAYDEFCFNTKQAGTCFSNYLLNFIGANETSEALSDF